MRRDYIVRIYRNEKDNPDGIVGLVEEPEVEGKRGFTNLDELWGILNRTRLIPDEGKKAVKITENGGRTKGSLVA